MTEPPDDLIGAKDAACILGLDRSTVLYRARRGQIPIIAKVSGSKGAYLFRRSDVEQLAAKKAAAK